jgi:uncharacterized protein YkwD
VGTARRGTGIRATLIAIALIAGLVALTPLSSSAATTAGASNATVHAASTNACDTSRADVLHEVNLVRQWFHLPLLRANSSLDGAAQAHVWYMYYAGAVTHGPGGNPPLWVKEITSHGYTPYSKLGQNLGGGMNNAHDLVSAWIGSLPHLSTMIDRDFQDLGVGCFRNTTGRGWPWYWAADFGRH